MSARTPSLFRICDFPTACWFIWNCPPEDEPPPFVLTAAESVWSLSCGSGGDMAWDRLTAARGSLCDYSLQRHFQKIALAVGSTWCSSLVLFFVFFSFGVFFNVAQRGVMEKGTLKAPPTTSRTAEPCSPARRGSFTPPARQWLKGCIFNSAELKERSQLCFSLSLSFFLVFICFNQRPPPPPSSHPPLRAVWFAFQICVSYFMVFWVAQDQLFLKFFTFESEARCERRALL